MKVPDHITHFVALDLGSESMAACYATYQMHEPEMIPLQEFAPLAYGESIRRLSGKKDYLLYESDGRTVSDRLKSVIFLRENQPHTTLGDDHARTAFIEWHSDNGVPEPRLSVSEWQRSIFELFSSQSGRHEHFLAMPNPKVLFQYKADKVLPRPRSTREDRAEVALDAELLITHLTTMIVNNLILNSSALHDVPRENIHLTLTVPNVYSVEHVERLRGRVAELTGLQSVAAISESDALAHYYWARQTEAPSGRKVKILTFDIGRGTTDVSLIQFETVGSSGNVLHEVVGRTGRTSGGGALTYIFAEYYEARIRNAFKRHLCELGFDNMPVGFTYSSEDRPESSEQFRQALVAFERYIDLVKRSFTSDYRLMVTEEAKKQIPAIVVGLVEELEAVLAPQYRRKMAAMDSEKQPVRHPMHQQETVALAEAGGDPGTILNKALDGFLKDVKIILEENTQVPEGGAFKTKSLASVATDLVQLPKSPLAKLKRLIAKLFKGWKIVEEEKPTRAEKLRDEDADLRDRLGRQIAEYVDENTDTLLIELAMMTVPDEQRVPDMTAEEALDALMKDGITHAVIGGQASQFAPIRRRLGELFQPGECEYLSAAELKKACCQGAVEWVRSGFVLKSPDSLFGTYAFVIRPPVQDWPVCIPLSTSRLNDPDVLAEEPLAPAAGSKILVSSTRTLHGPDDKLTLNDPTVSILGTFPAKKTDDEEPEKLRVTYEKRDGDTVRRLRVNDREAPSGSFGGTDRDIYPKVWPEQRRPSCT